MKRIIHINKNIIQYNSKHGVDLPVCRVEEGKKIIYGRSVEILGPSKMVYDPENPLRCGAKLWIETEAEIVIENPCTFADIQEMKKELR